MVIYTLTKLNQCDFRRFFLLMDVQTAIFGINPMAFWSMKERKLDFYGVNV